jgi:hypothetical protein
MVKLILTELTNYKHHMIDNTYKVYEVENVTGYIYANFKSWELEVNDIVNDNILNHDIIEYNYYFIADTLYDDAFGHWVAETGIYLPLFITLKKSYPTLKLVLRSEKVYKKLFCDFFGIKDVVYSLEPNNVSFFPSPISSLNDNNITEEFIKQTRIFRDCFMPTSPLEHEFVILPRQTKENCIPNDRVFCFKNLINHLGERARILNTDEITKLEDQINIVNSGKNICVTEGSPFYVNGLFCKNKNIYVVDISEGYKHQCVIYNKLTFLLELHKEYNNVIYISQIDLIIKTIET